MPQDASKYIIEAMEQLGGKGGGKGEVFTGGFVDVDDPKELFKSLVDAVHIALA